MIYNKFKSKSMLIIAHRLSTVKNCDTIIVLENGEIVEQGSHEQLLANGKMYTKLWNLQQGNFVADNLPDEEFEADVTDNSDGDEVMYT
jgi:ATP-binding cassette subfamily B protein